MSELTPVNKHTCDSGDTASVRQRKSAAVLQDNRATANRTGMPSQLKSGIEALGGINMDSVRVHYNSPKPAQLQAHAFAQGNEIHLATGQEQHLPHEAWHVVQQAQGRVKPTVQMKGVNVNDNAGLEREADVMGARATAVSGNMNQLVSVSGGSLPAVAQLQPMPSRGFPETFGLYNATPSSKKLFYDDRKVTFAEDLKKAVWQKYSGGVPGPLVTRNLGGGIQHVKQEFIQLDHNPSWSDRKKDMSSFPTNHPERMEDYVGRGLYLKADDKKYYPTLYAARMYYNDFESLRPSSPGLNASVGDQGVGDTTHQGNFKEEGLKEAVLHHVSVINESFIEQVNSQGGSSYKHVVASLESLAHETADLKGEVEENFSYIDDKDQMKD